MQGVGADVDEFEMTVTHSKILILVSKYGHCAVSPEESESWIRQLPLMVMVCCIATVTHVVPAYRDQEDGMTWSQTLGSIL